MGELADEQAADAALPTAPAYWGLLVLLVCLCCMVAVSVNKWTRAPGNPTFSLCGARITESSVAPYTKLVFATSTFLAVLNVAVVATNAYLGALDNDAVSLAVLASCTCSVVLIPASGYVGIRWRSQWALGSFCACNGVSVACVSFFAVQTLVTVGVSGSAGSDAPLPISLVALLIGLSTASAITSAVGGFAGFTLWDRSYIRHAGYTPINDSSGAHTEVFARERRLSQRVRVHLIGHL